MCASNPSLVRSARFFSVLFRSGSLTPPAPPPSSRSLPKYPRSRLYAQNRSPRSSSLTATPRSDLALERDRMIRGRRLNEAEIRDRLRPSVSEVEDEAREVRMARTGLDEAMKSLRRQYKFMLEENGKGPTLLLIQQVAEKEIQGMTPRSTPPTRLGPYSGSKSKSPPPPRSPFCRTARRSWCRSIDVMPTPIMSALFGRSPLPISPFTARRFRVDRPRCGGGATIR